MSKEAEILKKIVEQSKAASALAKQIKQDALKLEQAVVEAGKPKK